MKLGPLRFWRHLHYHRDIIKHLRWSAMDDQRKHFYEQLIAPGSLVFDIGANMGSRSKIFRAMDCQVVAYEPQSYCAEFLRVAFSGDHHFHLEQLALSDTSGETTLYLSKAHTLSTMDTQWMERMSTGERFPGQRWEETETVKLSTLHEQIEKYGLPDFMKIDVEGHEYQVLSGLDLPVSCLSLEFASESEENIKRCIDHLDSLGPYRYRLSLGESMQFEGDSWIEGSAMKTELSRLREADNLVWGDLYARLREEG